MNRAFVAFLRGLALTLLLAAVTFAIDFLGVVTLPPALDGLAPFVPVVIIGLRTLEGIVDQAKKGDDPNGATGLPTTALASIVVLLLTLAVPTVAIVLLL